MRFATCAGKIIVLSDFNVQLLRLIPDVNLMSVSFNFDRYFSQQAIRTTLVEKGLLPLGMEVPNIESLRIQGVYPLEFEKLYSLLRGLKEALVNPIFLNTRSFHNL